MKVRVEADVGRNPRGDEKWYAGLVELRTERGQKMKKPHLAGRNGQCG